MMPCMPPKAIMPSYVADRLRIPRSHLQMIRTLQIFLSRFRVMRSRVYNRNDPFLVKILASVCYKWSLTPWDRVLGFFHPKRIYQAAK
jgi:hypothetical protein